MNTTYMRIGPRRIWLPDGIEEGKANIPIEIGIHDADDDCDIPLLFVNISRLGDSPHNDYPTLIISSTDDADGYVKYPVQ